MKKTILLLVLLFPGLSLCAQDLNVDLMTEKDTTVKHEVGINVTRFFKTVVSFNNAEIRESNSLFLTYKRWVNENHALRFGIDALSFEKADEFDVGNETITVDVRTTSARVLMGYVLNKRISKHFLSYLSFDTFYFWSNEDSKKPLDNTGVRKLRINRFGLGPAVGIQFFITPKLSLSTELSFYYRYSFQQLQTDLFGDGGIDQFLEQKTHDVFFQSPGSLYFNFRF